MRKVLLSATVALLIAGCSEFPGVYKIDIPQGNVVTQEMVDQLRPGMTPAQVRYVMGTPLVNDSFSANRWDYIYSIKEGGKPRSQERISLFFEGGKLSRLSGDFRPGTTPDTP
ncbi:outer membrane protein assembly factor BamE [Marinobacterium weihaiense]|uniref:Outer membrane protein assembly factor BamE n=1 Tax=Marinobacterium weihaiense TaxID=2851016 RepID=A0ABS6M814_9GAMM|nr:outer membrane protein assembly factor BamE [Marinobacterium weihaiense]MBV0932380.1 outer membrane protein assembly factor BamE [Marinobacterium weihaiense]